MTNPLVAAPVDTSTPFQGAFLLEDGEALVQAIQSGDWVQGGLAAFSAVGDTIAAVLDPLGSLIAAGLGWVMEHLEPLKGWLNDLTGDAGEVAAFAQTWSNISAQLMASGDELARILADLDSTDGEAVQAYLRFQTDAAAHIRAAGTWAEAMSVGMQTASMMVQLVHDLTRDAIAQVVGSVISYAATLVVSLGTATPYVIAQATSRVAALATRVGTTVTKLLRSSDELMRLVDQLGTLFRKLDELTSKVLPGGGNRPTNGSGHPLETRGQLSETPSGPPSRGETDLPYSASNDGGLELGPHPGFRADGSIDPDAFRTAEDEAFFWSGRTGSVGGADVAGGFAGDLGGTTLEQLMERRGVTMPEWDADNPTSVATWKEASAAYADGVSGDVHVVLGESLRPGNVWETAEFPALMENRNVDRIIRIDPATGRQTQIWP